MTHLLKTFPAIPIDIDHAEDVWIYDVNGDKYLDLYGGHAVISTGHCHPHVVRAIQEQTGKLIFYSNAIGLPIREEAAAKLVSFAPKGLTQVFFANSGAEANENALKLAKRHTDRKKIISMEGSFHGRTAGAMAITGIPKYRDEDDPDVSFVPFGTLPEIDGETAAVIVEPIQGMGGVKTAPSGYFEKLRALCDKHGALLIFDEVQTGIGRTGEMFFGGAPDLITLAKGLGSGIPCSAVLVHEKIAEKVEYGQYGATFGAGPVAMAAVKATLEVVEDLLENVKQTGAYLAAEIAKIPGVKYRGKGFMVGIKMEADAKKVHKALLEKKILTGTTIEPDVLRLLPPLTLQKAQVDQFIAAFKEVLAHEPALH